MTPHTMEMMESIINWQKFFGSLRVAKIKDTRSPPLFPAPKLALCLVCSNVAEVKLDLAFAQELGFL